MILKVHACGVSNFQDGEALPSIPTLAALCMMQSENLRLREHEPDYWIEYVY